MGCISSSTVEGNLKKNSKTKLIWMTLALEYIYKKV